MTFITSLITVSSVATWIFLPLNAIFLTLDGIIFSLVAYSYKLFMLMAQMNFNVIYAWMGPLIDRVKALILVLILFKLGMSLIQYMLNPDKLEDKNIGGAALVKNIAISAAMLVCYSFVFSFFNEISLLIVGVPEGYTFTTLNDLAGVTYDDADKNGFLARFVFGSESEETEDFGKFLSVATLQIFLHGKDGTTSNVERIYDEMLAAGSDYSDFNMMEIVTVVAEIDRSVEYKWPILSGAIGCYLIYSIVKIAIEIGVRMFKLVILQILAPVAIISIIDKGFDSKIWKNFIDTFWKTYVDVFIRVGSMYLVTAIISKFWAEKTELFPEVDSFTRFLVMIIIIVAAYRLAMLLPKFIDSVFGSKLSENNKHGLANFVKGGLGAFAGGALGFATGLTSGAGGLGAMRNALAGFGSGAMTGFNSKADSIAGFFKEGKGMFDSNKKRAMGYSNTMIGGVGRKQTGKMENFDKRKEALDKLEQERNKAHSGGTMAPDATMRMRDPDDENVWVDRNASALFSTGYENVQFGDSAADYSSRMLEFDREYQGAQARLSAAEQSGDAYAIQQAQANLSRARQDSTRRTTEYWNSRKSTADSAEARAAQDTYNNLTGRAQGTHVDVATERKAVETQRRQLEQSRSYQRHHGKSDKK